MRKKRQVKVSPLRSGRRVRWTVEVSADLGPEKRAGAKRPVKKHAKRPTRERAVTNGTPSAQAPQAIDPTSTAAQSALTQSTARWQPTRGELGALAGAAVFIIAMVAVPRQPPPRDVARPHPEPRDSIREAATESPNTTIAPPEPDVAARPGTRARARTEPPKKAPVTRVTDRTVEPAKPASPGPVRTNSTAITTRSTMTAAAGEALPAAGQSPATASVPAVTITGCLEISTDGTEFRLADTEGRDAPKSRSWRTGFLRKRTAPVALIGAAEPLELKKNVGTRVAATGLLTDRALQVTSLRVVGSSCN